MKKLLPLFTLLLLAFTASAQVVVNEVIFSPTATVELKNLGSSAVDVSSYQLCSFPEYNTLGSLTLVSGDLMLGAGELLVVSGHSFSTSDDELGLYINGSYTNPASMLDYVEWGSSGHTRSSIAIMAGIWSSDSFVNIDGGGVCIEYDGEGDAPSDWLLNGTASPGAENSNVGGECEASAFVVGSQSICEGGTATFQLILTGIGPWTFTYSLDGVIQDPVSTSESPYQWMLTEPGFYNLMTVSDATCDGDASGSVTVNVTAPPTGELSGSSYCSIDTEPALSIAFTGQGPWTFDYAIDGAPQGENTVADNPYLLPVGVDGTYTLLSLGNNSCAGTASGSFDVQDNIAGGELSHMGAITAVNVCVDDDFPDPLTFDLSNALGLNQDIIVTDGNGIVSALPESTSIDFDGSEAGTCLVWNLASQDGLSGLAVGAQLPDDLTGCFELSNPITVNKQTGEDCVTSLDEFNGLENFMLYPNPAVEQLNVSYTLAHATTLYFSIIDLRGKPVLSQISSSIGGTDVVRLDVQNLSAGAYILQMTSAEEGHVQRVFMK